MGFERADLVWYRRRVNEVSNELDKLKEEISLYSLEDKLRAILVDISAYCREKCKAIKCSDCPLSRAIGKLESLDAIITRIKAKEMELIKLMADYLENMFDEEYEKELKELEEVLDDGEEK